jgi:hypothetical protein
MSASAKVERLHAIDHQLAMANLPDDKRRKLGLEKASLLADEEVRKLYEEQARAPNGQADKIDWSAVPPAAGYGTLADYATEVAQLATLPPHEYDRCRKTEAKRLEVRVGTLDADVKAARPRDAGPEGRGDQSSSRIRSRGIVRSTARRCSTRSRQSSTIIWRSASMTTRRPRCGRCTRIATRPRSSPPVLP